MHDTACQFMADHLQRIEVAGKMVLDVGSRNVNGTYRSLIEELGGEYTGVDIVDGPNVDVVSLNETHYPFPAESFDIVLSGSTAEHVRAIWWWMRELVRILKPEGLLVIVTHWQWKIHRHPMDCWRILPDGMTYLFDWTDALDDYLIDTDEDGTIAGSAFKTEIR